jgi:hypothetical protein
MSPKRACRAASVACALATGLCAVSAVPARDILDLQPQLRRSVIELAGGHSARLDNPAPSIGAWYLLTLDAGSPRESTFHLEAAVPLEQPPRLDAANGGRLVLRTQAGAACTLPFTALEAARRVASPFAPLCDGHLFLRNPVRGHRTALEATTEFLRDHVWGGERIIGFVRHQFYEDAFALQASGAGTPSAPVGDAALPAPRLAPAATARTVVPVDLGLDVGPALRGVRLGQWVPVHDRPGVFVDVLVPSAIASTPASRGHPPWHPDAVESEALAYFVAFDLARFDLGFALGTEHPRLGWSDHTAPALRDEALPGPDGIADAAPFVRTGMLDPADVARAVATFTGGFKREHGAFRYGPLSTSNRSSHYGFVEEGVVFSTLQPGLSTLFVTRDGRVDIKTWQAADAALLPTLRFARQNGVPLVERTPQGSPAIGALVDQWGPGNWSGSADEHLRTLRAGACILDNGKDRHLVYGYFSTATPGTMARMFLALGCREAMHLDMNALEHTYLALYGRAGKRLDVQHLVGGMSVLDQNIGGALVPRFLGFADDRDFFYLLDKEAPR